MWPHPAEIDHTTLSEQQKDAIREQLSRLLTSPYFSQSKRSVTFLTYIIDHTLAGEAEKIKERTLGIAIFGRGADYDTASDPVVRVTASEIRKRVAQYYLEPGHEDELRITLPSGSYIPHFHWPKNVSVAGLESVVHRSETQELIRVDAHLEETLGLSAARPGESPFNPPDLELLSGERYAHLGPHHKARGAYAPRHFGLILALSCVMAGLLSAGVVFIWQAVYRPASGFFWRPVLTASDPVLICVADQLQDGGIALRDTTDPTRLVFFKSKNGSKSDNFTTVAIDDLNAIIEMAGILRSSGKPYTLKGEGTTNLVDLRSGPTIFVGAFDNVWTLRLTESLRFHFANDPDLTRPRIEDSANPAQTRWAAEQYRSLHMDPNSYRDYAIVARFTDGTTGKLAVVVAGIGRGGTLAAGQFLTSPSDLVQLERAAKAAGNKNNLEVVLSTQVIDGQPGSPKVEAVYFW
jgi:hypothetical protein